MDNVSYKYISASYVSFDGIGDLVSGVASDVCTYVPF